ncbi:hypothetical protein LTR84_005766 [Exophiala bonariae]|uniref:4-dimethylallyltryptophan N-methyltransferase n=1 Tax=Exophiala bonariae TaxID=1690606 RepID=A0AAV9N3H1_9EURO|nr:hypothetical protein LTR84_005766 [Exophiala bonariae]
MTNIIDIRDECQSQNLRRVLEDSLLSQQPSIPPLLLWDEQGMELFSKMTEKGSTNSYGSSAEMEVLSAHVDDISKICDDGGILIDLGAGSLHKSSFVVKHLAARNGRVQFYALDISPEYLQKSLDSCTPQMQQLGVQSVGLAGTFKDLISWLYSNGHTFTKPVTYLWLGNSMANLSIGEVATTLQQLIIGLPSRIRGSTKFILGLDACNDHKEIIESYTSKPTELWALNALKHANSLIGTQVFRLDEWEYQGEYDDSTRCFTASFVARRDVEMRLRGKMHRFTAGQPLKLAHSYKWNRGDLESLLESTNLEITNCWKHTTPYCEHFPLEYLSPNILPG